MTTDIEKVTTAIAEFDRVGAGLEMLQKTFGGVLYEVESSQGMTAAKAARATLREPRYEVERIRKDAKAPLIAIGKRLDEEAKRITGELMKLEDPIDQQIKSEESRKEREAQARIAAEAARVSVLAARVDAIRALPLQANGKSAEQIKALHESAAAMVIGEDFKEQTDAARQAHAAAVAALFGLHQMAVNDETERERIRMEREELVKFRAEQERRDAAERERLAAEQAEQRRLQALEQVRIDEQRRANEAEAQRLAKERQQIEAAKAPPVVEPAPKPTVKVAVKRPTDEEIAAVLAQHYGVSIRVICNWLCKFGQVVA